MTGPQQKTFALLAVKHSGCEVSWGPHSQWSDRIFIYVDRGEEKLRYSVQSDGKVLWGGRPTRIDK